MDKEDIGVKWGPVHKGKCGTAHKLINELQGNKSN